LTVPDRRLPLKPQAYRRYRVCGHAAPNYRMRFDSAMGPRFMHGAFYRAGKGRDEDGSRPGATSRGPFPSSQTAPSTPIRRRGLVSADESVSLRPACNHRGDRRLRTDRGTRACTHESSIVQHGEVGSVFKSRHRRCPRERPLWAQKLPLAGCFNLVGSSPGSRHFGPSSAGQQRAMNGHKPTIGWLITSVHAISLHDQQTAIANWTAKAAKRRLTAIGLVEPRWMIDCTILAPSSQKANASVIPVRDVIIAIAKRPPKIGRPSTQLA